MNDPTSRTVVVPYDLRDPSDEALAAAKTYAGPDAVVSVLYVVPPIAVQATGADARNLEAQAALDETRDQLVARLQEAGCPEFRAVVAWGPPAARLVEYIEAEKPDLVVMPSHGRRGLKRLVLGSVTESVLRRARVPVLVIPLRS